MEPGGISIIPTTGITESSVGKSKSIGITFPSSTTVETAKEKLKIPWLSNLMKEEATVWETLNFAFGEVIGTAILVFLGCSGCVGGLGIDRPRYQVSLTFGLSVMIAIQCVGHISGSHINPSISVAALILGKRSLPMSVCYIIAQCLGSLTGFGLLKMLTPSEVQYFNSPEYANSFCNNQVSEHLTNFQAVMAEFMATSILVLFACGVWDYRNSAKADSVPLRFGFCITALSMIFSPYTGCSLNPARSLGPAIWNGYWDKHWVFWLGPLSGSITASVIYRFIFLYKSAAESESI